MILFARFIRFFIFLLKGVDPRETGLGQLDGWLSASVVPWVEKVLGSRIPPPKPEAPQGVFGVNLYGYFRRAGSGAVGLISSTTADLLREEEIPCSELAVESYLSIPVKAQTPKNDFHFNLFQINAKQMTYLYPLLGASRFRGRSNIGYWYWELERFPERWKNVHRCLREIWVASEFSRKSIQAAVPIPVTVVPPVVQVSPAGRDRSRFGITKEVYVFLFVFDFFSYFERKNPLAVVRAFKKAFQETPGVELVIKCANSHRFPKEKAELAEECSQKNISLLDRELAQEEAHDLIRLADAYVSLHRSEGFGLTIAEAMLLKKPVIVTAYSGNMDFTTRENSHLVRYEKVAIPKPVGPYPEGFSWAEPDIAHAAECMRRVFENPGEAAVKAERAARDIEDRFNKKTVGGLVKSRLQELWRQKQIPVGSPS